MSSMSDANVFCSSLTSFSRSSSDSFLTLMSSESAQRWSSSPKPACSPELRYAMRASREARSSSTRSVSSWRSRVSSSCISASSLGRSRQRASWSTHVTIDAAKYRIFSSSLGAMSSR